MKCGDSAGLRKSVSLFMSLGLDSTSASNPGLAQGPTLIMSAFLNIANDGPGIANDINGTVQYTGLGRVLVLPFNVPTLGPGRNTSVPLPLTIQTLGSITQAVRVTVTTNYESASGERINLAPRVLGFV